jgi:hypothetical protein
MAAVGASAGNRYKPLHCIVEFSIMRRISAVRSLSKRLSF